MKSFFPVQLPACLFAVLFCIDAAAQPAAGVKPGTIHFPDLISKQLKLPGWELPMQTRLAKALEGNYTKDFAIDQVSFDVDQLEELRNTLLKPNQASSVNPILISLRSKAYEQSVLKHFPAWEWTEKFGIGTEEILHSETALPEKWLSSTANLKKILLDQNLNHLRIANFDLKKLDLARFSDKAVKLCKDSAGICGKAVSSGWIENAKRATLILTIDENSDQGHIILTNSGGLVSGVAITKDGTEVIREIGDGQFAVTRSAVVDRNTDDVVSMPKTDGTSVVQTLYTPEPGLFPNSITQDDDCPGPKETAVVDLVVGYSQRAELEARNKGFNIEDLIATAESIANLSFKRSGINGNIHIRQVDKITYSEQGDYATDMAEISPTGKLKGLWDMRRTAKGDIAIMVVHNADPTVCGKAAEIGAKGHRAFAVVNWQCVTDRYSFIHEVAHLAGAWHDPQSVGTGYKVLPEYASGYVTTGAVPIATIMAYISSCPKTCARALYWANPFLKTKDGQDLGTKSKNFDACVWRKRLPVMSKFSEQLK